MTAAINRQWILAEYPTAGAQLSNWTLHETTLPQLGPGQILIRNKWLSVDPYLRGKMHASQGGVKIGNVMMGAGVGEVVTSTHPDWQAGDLAEALNVGWSEYAVLTPGQAGPASVNRVSADVPAQAALHWLGMPGITAYFGMMEIALPRPGDVVVVSAAAGGVGQIAGQIAKLAGCRVIGIAGDDDKLAWCKSIGYDEVINYRKTTDLSAALSKLCPQGVNVFFDCTGGSIHDAVLPHLAVRARVVICGKIAVTNLSPNQDIGLRASALLIASRATMQGLMVFDYWHRRDEAMTRLKSWHDQGKLQVREDICSGIETVPDAFLRIMAGKNAGKQLIRL